MNYILNIAQKISCIKDALNFAMKLIQLIKFSPKQQVVFETVDCSKNSEICTLCVLHIEVDCTHQINLVHYRYCSYESLQVTLWK